MFELGNPVSFKYYPHFLVIYGLCIVIAISLVIYRKKLDKSKSTEKKVARGLTSAFEQAGIYGLLLLLARKIKIHFFSMEFLHILNLSILSLVFIYFMYRLKKGYPARKKKA